MTSPQVPSIGRIVLYESATGSGVKYPAIVIRTRASTNPATIKRWGPTPSDEIVPKPDSLVAELPDDFTVDLLVHGLVSSYREYAVPMGSGGRTWDWPPRA